MAMRILLRHPTLATANIPSLHISPEGTVFHGQRKYVLSKTPGFYFVMPYHPTGMRVPHYNPVLTHTVTAREQNHGKETTAVLNAAQYRGYIAAYVVEDNGDVILLVNSEAIVDETLESITEDVRLELREMNNPQLLSHYTDMDKYTKGGRAKSELLRRTILNDCLANQQLQIDLLMEAMNHDSSLKKPEWWTNFVSAMEGQPSAPRPLERKGIPDAIAEVRDHRSAINELIQIYKTST